MDDLFEALKRDRRYLAFQLADAVGLSDDDIALLISRGIFPAARCHAIWGPSWNRIKIDAWAWGVKNSPRLADRVTAALGRDTGSLASSQLGQ